MLSVFLIALFALTISEIAYNRQRDENFFKLRWYIQIFRGGGDVKASRSTNFRAELKHRMGYNNDANSGPFSLFHRNLFNQMNSEPITSKALEGNKM